MRLLSAADAAGVVQSGQSVYLHCAAATPSVVLQALVDRAPELHDVSVAHRPRPSRLPGRSTREASRGHLSSRRVGRVLLIRAT